MSILIDTSYLYALYNAGDKNHASALDFALKNKTPSLVPMVILPEVAFLFERDLGHAAIERFLLKFTETATPLEPVGMNDLKRAGEITAAYQEVELDLVDCCIMALAERLNITQICPFDRRDFSLFRPKHGDYLALLPG